MSFSSQRINPTTTQPPHEKPEAGASWKAAEQHVLPYNRLWIVLPGLMACISLAALDQVLILAMISSFPTNQLG